MGVPDGNTHNMPDVSDIDNAIAQAATEPQMVSVDGQSVTGRSIADLELARRAVSARQSLSGTNSNGGPVSGWACLRPARVQPPGAQ